MKQTQSTEDPLTKQIINHIIQIINVLLSFIDNAFFHKIWAIQAGQAPCTRTENQYNTKMELKFKHG